MDNFVDRTHRSSNISGSAPVPEKKSRDIDAQLLVETLGKKTKSHKLYEKGCEKGCLRYEISGPLSLKSKVDEQVINAMHKIYEDDLGLKNDKEKNENKKKTNLWIFARGGNAIREFQREVQGKLSQGTENYGIGESIHIGQVIKTLGSVLNELEADKKFQLFAVALNNDHLEEVSHALVAVDSKNQAVVFRIIDRPW